MARIIGRRIIHYEQVTSTNDLAREWAELGEAEGLVVTAEGQSSGRGRLGRGWNVPPRSSIQLSVLLRPPLHPSQATSTMQLAAIAVGSTLREFVGKAACSPSPTVRLKWPNDVLLNEKKCAGILVETGVEGDTLAYAIVGIGINVNFSMREYPALAPFATTLADELGHPVERDALEDDLLARLDASYARLRQGEEGRLAVFEEWRNGLSTLGCPVRVATQRGIEQGIAENVSPDGALLLRRDRDLIKLYSGDVTVLKEPIERSPK